MKCPKCGKNTAYLVRQDGITQPCKNLPVEIRCECTMGEYQMPEGVGYCLIDVVLKRGSVKLYDD